ncbi:MAG: DUF3093 family protein [Candidatus Nanopelagicales bacterium]
MNKSVKSAPKFQFIEKRYPPLWVLATSIVFSLSLGVALFPRVGALYSATVVLSISCISIYSWNQSKSPIVLSDTSLRVGRAEIERSFLSGIDVLPSHQFLERIRGKSLSTDYYSLRSLHYGGVVIGIDDDADPHKHWVVSMKRGNDLKKLLQRGISE